MGTSGQARPFEEYRIRVSELTNHTGKPSEVWKQIYDWYNNDGGRDLFLQAFKHETDLKINPETNTDSRIGAAIPKSLNDQEKKVIDDTYYRAHAEMFIIEMDHITSQVPRECDDPTADFAYGNVLGFVKYVILDSIVLFEHWGALQVEVPGVFGAVMNELTDPVNFYHGAHQTIYGHGTFGLSFCDNHAELAVATIRQAIEVRLRRGFGVIGKKAISDGTLHPVALSDLFVALKCFSAGVQMPVPLHNVMRINHWANLCLHTGVRHYSWTPPRVIDYLQPLVAGGEAAPGQCSADSGIRVRRSSFDAIRRALKMKIESTTQPNGDPQFRALLLQESDCSVIIEDENPTPTQ